MWLVATIISPARAAAPAEMGPFFGGISGSAAACGGAIDWTNRTEAEDEDADQLENAPALQVSVTRGPTDPPVVNVCAWPPEGGSLQLHLRLDLAHAQDLIDQLIGACALIEDDMFDAAIHLRQ